MAKKGEPQVNKIFLGFICFVSAFTLFLDTARGDCYEDPLSGFLVCDPSPPPVVVSPPPPPPPPPVVVSPPPPPPPPPVVVSSPPPPPLPPPPPVCVSVSYVCGSHTVHHSDCDYYTAQCRESMLHDSTYPQTVSQITSTIVRYEKTDEINSTCSGNNGAVTCNGGTTTYLLTSLPATSGGACTLSDPRRIPTSVDCSYKISRCEAPCTHYHEWDETVTDYCMSSCP